MQKVRKEEMSMLKNQKGVAVVAILGLVVVVGLFVAYVSGNPPQWGTKTPVAVVQPVVVEPVVVEPITTEVPHA